MDSSGQRRSAETPLRREKIARFQGIYKKRGFALSTVVSGSVERTILQPILFMERDLGNMLLKRTFLATLLYKSAAQVSIG